MISGSNHIVSSTGVLYHSSRPIDVFSFSFLFSLSHSILLSDFIITVTPQTVITIEL